MVGVWGTGFIGFSSMANFAARGVRCIGTDVVKKTVEEINRGKIVIDNLEYWLGFNTSPLVESGMIRATLNWRELISRKVAVHLICVPTEKDGKPYDAVLEDVIKKLTSFKDVKTDSPPLVIIESTLTPNRTNDVVIPIF
ncbi:MAG: hypothetical protein ACE5NL_01900, partial [Candidatus Hydrothermarchaeaceae archaeon]